MSFIYNTNSKGQLRRQVQIRRSVDIGKHRKTSFLTPEQPRCSLPDYGIKKERRKRGQERVISNLCILHPTPERDAVYMQHVTLYRLFITRESVGAVAAHPSRFVLFLAAQDGLPCLMYYSLSVPAVRLGSTTTFAAICY